MEISAPLGLAGNADGSKSDLALADLANNLDNFLTILTTQLQYQDPLSPMETNEFTNQLVMFTGVEQQVQQNQNLEELIALQSNNLAIGAVTYIGKVVEASGNTTTMKDGNADFSYTLPQNAKTAALQVFNAGGKLVFAQAVDSTAGRHELSWDGIDQNGFPQPDGAYTFKVSALDDADVLIDVETTVFGKVTGVEFAEGLAILNVGTVGVPLANILGVIDENA